MSVFDRSWYGRVLVERVEGFADREAWLRAYDEINDFERTLADEGMILIKFWMHISDEEQLKRFERREQEPAEAVEADRRGLAQSREAPRLPRGGRGHAGAHRPGAERALAPDRGRLEALRARQGAGDRDRGRSRRGCGRPASSCRPRMRRRPRPGQPTRRGGAGGFAAPGARPPRSAAPRPGRRRSRSGARSVRSTDDDHLEVELRSVDHPVADDRGRPEPGGHQQRPFAAAGAGPVAAADLHRQHTGSPRRSAAARPRPSRTRRGPSAPGPLRPGSRTRAAAGCRRSSPRRSPRAARRPSSRAGPARGSPAAREPPQSSGSRPP